MNVQLKDIEDYSFSIIMRLGYGVASSFVDYPDNEIRSVAQKPKVFICIFLLVMGDFLWRCVPVSLLFANYEFVPPTFFPYKGTYGDYFITLSLKWHYLTVERFFNSQGILWGPRKTKVFPLVLPISTNLWVFSKFQKYKSRIIFMQYFWE